MYIVWKNRQLQKNSISTIFNQIMSLSELKENYYHTNWSETISIHTDIHILDTHKYLFESFAVNEGELEIKLGLRRQPIMRGA